MTLPLLAGKQSSVRLRAALAMCLVLAILQMPASGQDAQSDPPQLRGALLAAEDASPARLDGLQADGLNTLVIPLDRADPTAKQAVRAAVAHAEQAGLSIAYWIEVARCPELADQHPEWMASLQTHDEWRRFFPDSPQPEADEVAKTYPWVPILSHSPFNAQRDRVLALLAELPQPKLIFLNDLQGAPSACGCGNPLCRWTSDYGGRRTTVPLGDDAAARFCQTIGQAVPAAEVIPVWTTECEEHDGSPDGLCAGVGCFKGICWKAYTRQLMPVAQTHRRIGVLALTKEFQRDIPHYGPGEARWVEFAVQTFQSMPPKHQGEAIAAARIIAVVQGWDVTPQEIAAQREAASRAGAGGYVVAYAKIEQSWSPKIMKWK